MSPSPPASSRQVRQGDGLSRLANKPVPVEVRLPSLRMASPLTLAEVATWSAQQTPLRTGRRRVLEDSSLRRPCRFTLPVRAAFALWRFTQRNYLGGRRLETFSCNFHPTLNTGKDCRFFLQRVGCLHVEYKSSAASCACSLCQ